MKLSSDTLGELATALSAAQGEFTAIPKDATNPFFKSKYADLPKVIEVASPILTKHGLSVSQFIGHEDGEDTLTTWLLHKSGEFICDSMRLHLSKKDAQGQGSATTYARRYSYMAVLGLVADVDDDGQAASSPPPARAAASPTRRSAAKPAAAEVVTAEQRRDVLLKANQAGLDPAELANTIKAVVGLEPALFESEDQARGWVNRNLEVLPARFVAPLMASLDSRPKVTAA